MTLRRSRFSKPHAKQARQGGSGKPSRAISTVRTRHRANQARSQGDGTICEAQEIKSLGYGEGDEWVCSDTKCSARMIPCAWNDDKEYKKAPYFKTYFKDDHVEGCTGTQAQRDRSKNEPSGRRSGLPAELPTRVFLKESPPSEPPTPLTRREEALVDGRPPGEGHEHTRRSIRAACQGYADYPDRRYARLRVDDCDGETYRDVFVLLGTVDASLIGSTRILYSQIQFTSGMNLDCDRLELPLFYPDWTRENPKRRHLVVDTLGWTAEQRELFKNSVKGAIREGQDAFKSEMPERPWVFFVGAQYDLDQVEFRFTHPAASAAITAFACYVPTQHRPIRRGDIGRLQAVPPAVEKVSDAVAPSTLPDEVPSSVTLSSEQSSLSGPQPATEPSREPSASAALEGQSPALRDVLALRDVTEKTEVAAPDSELARAPAAMLERAGDPSKEPAQPAPNNSRSKNEPPRGHFSGWLRHKAASIKSNFFKLFRS
jgi:hypothetical protein